jgi:hypothetical protein
MRDNSAGANMVLFNHVRVRGFTPGVCRRRKKWQRKHVGSRVARDGESSVVAGAFADVE